MEINYFQKNLSERESKSFLESLQKKQKSIEGLIKHFAHDAAILKATVEKFDKHDAYEVEFCLSLPTKSLVAKEASHDLQKALELSKERLVMQIKKHIEVLREGRSHKTLKKDAEKTTIAMEELIENM